MLMKIKPKMLFISMAFVITLLVSCKNLHKGLTDQNSKQWE